jgi:hypothetical protein
MEEAGISGHVMGGFYLHKDGRQVFENTGTGQQFLVNPDGSMVTMGTNAGCKVILNRLDPPTISRVDEEWIEDRKTLYPQVDIPNLKSFAPEVIEDKVTPGFVCLQTSEYIRFDPLSGSDSTYFMVQMLDPMHPLIRDSVKCGMFLFCFFAECQGGPIRLFFPEYPNGR